VVDCIHKWLIGFVEKKLKISFREIKISFSNGELGCKVLGTGIKKMISFHGFGQSGFDYLPLSEAMPEYTFFSIELPFHGMSHISDAQQPISSAQVIELMENLMVEEDISIVSLCGFSIGAKFLFPIIENLHRFIDQVFFLAPEGISSNFWYRLATSTKMARGIFFRLVHNQKAMRKLVGLAVGLKIISGKVGMFATRALAANGKGRLVYDTWCSLRFLKLHHDKAALVINSSGIKVVFAYGSEDHIIRKNTMLPLYRRINKSEVLDLSCGHHDLIRHFSRSNFIMQIS
jgi:pimeloyl-ACP methyl ester carboxylesterase